MLDSHLLRSDAASVADKLKIRGFTLDIAAITELEEQRKVLQTATQELQHQRNSSSKAIGIAKAKGEDIAPLLKEVSELGDALVAKEKQLSSLQTKLQDLYYQIPNLPDSSVPAGNSEDDNVEVRRWGTPKEFNFNPKEHVDLLGAEYLDFTAAANISGARFVILHAELARLHRALIQFMLDTHTQSNGL